MTAPALTASGLSERLPWHSMHHIHDPDSDGTEPPLTFTCGLAHRPGRAYELAVTGLGFWLALSILTKAAEQLVDDGLDPAEGMELDRVLNGRRVRLRRVLGHGVLPGVPTATRVWQVLTPDKWGRFPGDHHYDLPEWPQPLL
ncbi:DUF4262 domain-containing protein [Streptomyces longwoodensis]|uniref:DUF4262 domain-containing protein n=1 Tax=Streptomyces longwoodensis TaxID=68231 RepID=UPI00340EC65D